MMDTDNESSILSALLSLKHGGNFATLNSTNDQCDNYTTISGHSDDVLLMEPVGNNTSTVPQKSKKVKKRKLASVRDAEGDRDPQLIKTFKSGNLHIKLMRGRYKCSLCGAFKTNHVCALVPDKLMCSVGVQSAPHSQETCEAVMHTAVSCDEDTTTSTKITCSLKAISGSLDSMDSTAGTHPAAILTSSTSNSNIAASNSNTTTSKLLAAGMTTGLETLYDKVYSDGIKHESTANEGGTSTPPTTTSTTALQPPLLSLISTHGIFRERIITVSRNRPSIQNTTSDITATTTTPDAPLTTTTTVNTSILSAEVTSAKDTTTQEHIVNKQQSCSTKQPPVLLSGMVSGLVPSDQDARLDAAMTAAAHSLKLPHHLPSTFLCPAPASPSSLLSPKMLLMKQEYTKHHLVEQEGENDAAHPQLLLSADTYSTSGNEERFHCRAVSIADGDVSDSKVKGYYKPHHSVKAMILHQQQYGGATEQGSRLQEL